MKRSFKVAAPLVAAAVIGVDRLTKYLVSSNMELYESFPLIPRVLNITYIENRGAAFGMFQNGTLLFTILTVIAVVGCALLIAFNVTKSQLANWALVLFGAGGVGNLIDRVFRRSVVDFIETAFVEFPVFNIADCSVTVGAALLVVYLVRGAVRPRRKAESG